MGVSALKDEIFYKNMQGMNKGKRKGVRLPPALRLKLELHHLDCSKETQKLVWSVVCLDMKLGQAREPKLHGARLTAYTYRGCEFH